jgi:hypothetical protein
MTLNISTRMLLKIGPIDPLLLDMHRPPIKDALEQPILELGVWK